MYYTQYHLVFVTKYRRKVLVNNMSSYLKAVLKNVEKRYPELEIKEMNADKGHIHIWMLIPPKYSVAETVRILKTNSARAMRNKFEFLKRMYEHKDVGLWSDGYFVSTVGINEQVIERYIKEQGKEDKGGAQLEMI